MARVPLRCSLILGLLVPLDLQARDFGFGNPIAGEWNGSSLESTAPFDLSTLVSKVGGYGFAGLSDSALRDALEEKGLHPHLGLRRRHGRVENNIGLTRSGQSLMVTDYDYTHSGFPICDTTIRTVRHETGETVMVGNVPLVQSPSQFSSSEWPLKEDAFEYAAAAMANKIGASAEEASLMDFQPCLYNLQGHLQPSWEFSISFSSRTYRVFGDDRQIFSAAPWFFDATARIQAYDPNVTTGTLKTFQVTVDGSGTLTNNYFTTEIYAGGSRQQSASNTFNYTGKDIPSAESSTFAYVNQHLDYLTSVGYSWGSSRQITVISNVAVKGDVNNAYYSGPTSSSGPTIYVGMGDGTILTNLAFDADVASHELGHHVVFASITSTDGESLALHEGLADFFALARTGEMCLGESVCPAGTRVSACRIQSNRCLRSADNTMKYNDATYTSYIKDGHMSGQLISGLLWDLRKTNAMPADLLSRYVLQAITYLPTNAQFKNFVAALLYTDSQNGSTYQAAITSALATRGLAAATLGVDTNDLKTSASTENAATPAAATNDSESSGGGGIFGCAVSGYQQNQTSHWWLVVVLGGLPFVLTMSRPLKRPCTLKVRAGRLDR